MISYNRTLRIELFKLTMFMLELNGFGYTEQTVFV